jgi:LmbE family N-acetylglucosaminyl deacetylase
MITERDYVPYETLDSLPAGPVLVLAPHADDEVIGCGGVLAQHVKRGDHVRVVIMTDGAAATTHASEVACADYRSRRLLESRNAAHILGYDPPDCLGLPDRGLEEYEPLGSTLLELAREVDAATIYAPSVQEVHPDHHALGMALCEIASQLAPSLTVMFYEVGYPAAINALVDISRDVDAKRAALRCFESQLALRDYLRHMEALDVYRTYTLDSTVQAAEGYLRLSAAELAASPMRRFGRSRVTDAFAA